MERYYIAKKTAWQQNLHLFGESHYIDLPEEGLILVCAIFTARTHEANWSKMEDVEPLPHPLVMQIINDRHVSLLAYLGVGKGDRTDAVAKAAEKVHPGMRFSGI